MRHIQIIELSVQDHLNLKHAPLNIDLGPGGPEIVIQVAGTRKTYTPRAQLNGNGVEDATEKQFVCEHCGKTCSTSTQLRGHINYHHKDLISKTGDFKCPAPGCKKRFGSPSGLDTHRFKAHGIKGTQRAKKRDTK